MKRLSQPDNNANLYKNLANPVDPQDAATKTYVDRRKSFLTVGTSDADYITDGSADEVQIQQAIDALPSTGGKVSIKDGTYTFSATVNIQKNNVVLEGAGNATVLKMANSTNIVLLTLGHSSTQYNYLQIKNLYFDGNGSNQSNSVSGAAWVDNISATVPMNNVLIENCTFVNARVYGINTSGDNISIKGCVFNTWGIGTQCAAIYNGGATSGSTSTINHMILDSCFFYTNTACNEYVDSGYHSKAIITNCHFSVPAGYTGIEVIHCYGYHETITDCYFDIGNGQSPWSGNFAAIHGGMVIANNVIVFNGTPASTSVAIEPASNSTVTGNKIVNTAKGIYCENTFGYRAVISNNYITSNYAAIDLDNSFQSTITGNFIQPGAGAAGSISAITIRNGASSNIISGNRINGESSFVNGIKESASGDGPNVITNNICTGMTGTAISTLNSSTVVDNNLT
jgi:hypothetical protein